jgi:hypothetical protein
MAGACCSTRATSLRVPCSHSRFVSPRANRGLHWVAARFNPGEERYESLKIRFNPVRSDPIRPVTWLLDPTASKSEAHVQIESRFVNRLVARLLGRDFDRLSKKPNGKSRFRPPNTTLVSLSTPNDEQNPTTHGTKTCSECEPAGFYFERF